MISGLSQELERILVAGSQAPSGENCQPWHFVVLANTVEVHVLPERDQSAYGWGQRGSYLANGAAIENMIIAASGKGYRVDVAYFPNSTDKYHVATLTLTKDSTVKPDPLTFFIFKRVSNRKPYGKEPLSSEARQALMAAGQGALTLVEAPEDIRCLGRVGSTNEEVMLANQSLHSFFFSHINWTKEEDDKKKIGFYIKTLELPPPAQIMFRLFKKWGIMRLFLVLGFNRVVAIQNGVTNAAASAIGGLTVSGTEPIDFVKVGRAVERLWLIATSLGLSFQPMTGVLFFKLKIKGGEGSDFSTKEKDTILSAYQVAVDIFKAGDRHLAFMFRVGKGEPPSAQAVRFPLVDTVTIRPKKDS
jgi:nitroreductase